MKIKYILLFLIFIYIFIRLFNIINSSDYFNNNDSVIIVSNLTKNTGSGFYSQLFFTLNHYIYCKSNNINFKINSDTWLFSHKNGWSDYFNNVELNFYESNIIKNYKTTDILGKYTVQNYIDAIHDIYVYNENTITEINKIKNQFNLIDFQYDSIFIRRGDKLANESRYYPEELYLKLLLQKNPNCSIIFLQTDDYNSYLNLQKYINDNDLSIKLYTICNENSKGAILSKNQKKYLNYHFNNDKQNSKYISTIITELNNTKTVEDMNKDEIYTHVLNMLIGIDISLHSNICITDYQSNVARFVKLAHTNPDNVYNIINQYTNLDYNKIIMPAIGF
jgi:hypothetical protein